MAALTFAMPLFAAERYWDFTDNPTNQPPTNCFSTLAGEGKPGTWKVIRDEFPLALQPVDPNAPKTAPKSVVAQLAWDHTDEHFPMLILGDDTYGDFTFRTKFKIVDGLSEQIAGIAFRIQDEQNYYYVRASALGNTFNFYSVSKGQRSPPVGNFVKIERGVWHDLLIRCTGPDIHIELDGNANTFPGMTNLTYSAGKIAYMTKSDSISYFADSHITFTPREPFAQVIVRDVMHDNPRLVGVKIFMATPKAKNDIHMVASNNAKEIGAPAEKTDADVIDRGVNYFRKDKENVYVTIPLRDRNGDPVAAVQFVMRSFPGQTEENAMTRALPMIKDIQKRALAVENLY